MILLSSVKVYKDNMIKYSYIPFLVPLVNLRGLVVVVVGAVVVVVVVVVVGGLTSERNLVNFGHNLWYIFTKINQIST